MVKVTNEVFHAAVWNKTKYMDPSPFDFAQGQDDGFQMKES